MILIYFFLILFISNSTFGQNPLYVGDIINIKLDSSVLSKLNQNVTLIPIKFTSGLRTKYSYTILSKLQKDLDIQIPMTIIKPYDSRK